MNRGRDLKICDFGNARDVTVHSMTCTIGTAAWMAPEVILGKYYDEKCDIYSWAIIFWEILARKVPHKNFPCNEAILFAVPNGRRPPLSQNWPDEIQSIMTMSWADDPNERPSMEEIEKHMNYLFKQSDDQYLEPIFKTKCDHLVSTSNESLKSLNQLTEATNESRINNGNILKVNTIKRDTIE